MKLHNGFSKLLLVVLFSFCLFGAVFTVDVQGSEITEKEKLLYGYDVTGEKNLYEIDAFKKKIIDPNSGYLNDENIECFTGMEQETGNYIKHSLSEVVSEFALETSSGAFGRIYVVDADVSSAFDISRKITNACDERYELYTLWIARRMYKLNIKPYLIKNYLDESFKTDLYSVKSKSDAKTLFNEYGTHLITGFMYGGRMIITNYQATNDASTDINQGASLKSKVDAAIGCINAGASASIVEQYAAHENTNTSISNYSFKAVGGVAVSGLTLDGLFTYNQSLTNGNNAGFMYTRWIDSINNDENLTIIGIPNGANSIPLWELLDENDERSNSIKQNLIDAYIDICGDKYDEYQKKYQYNRAVVSDYDQEDSILPDYYGAYIRTQNGYFYYVDKTDLASDENHPSLQNKDYVYLDYEKKDDADTISFDVQGCKKINENQGIFQVEKSSGRVVITVKCGESSKKLIDVPIIESGFEGGSGTEEYPYIIVNAEQFKQISNNPSAYYVLNSDIDFKGSALSSMGEFSGVLDGNYCKITNFKINQDKEWGLFSKNKGTIKNLAITNAGTSCNLSDFKSGGVDFANDYQKETYLNNSIAAINAGIICATNEGTIEGCFVDNVFIRNIVKDRKEYINNLKISLNVGAVSGINSGKINDTKVSNSCVLNSFIFEKEDADVKLENYVHTGGLIGEMRGGTVSGCVFDTDVTGMLMSQNNIIYDGSIANHCHAKMQSYSAGLIGYCDSENATIKNNYCFIRNIANVGTYKAIDAEYKHGWHEPDTYSVLCSAAVIYGENASVGSDGNYVLSNDPTVISSSLKSTDNNEEKNEDNTFAFVEGFSEKTVYGQTDLNAIGLNSEKFLYDTTQNSHIAHILQKSRKAFIELEIDISNGNYCNEFFDGQYFSPKNISLTRHINSKTAENVQYFKIWVQEGATNCLDTKLEIKQSGTYSIKFSIYDNEIHTSTDTIEVKENKVIGIAVENEEGKNEFAIYYDKKDDYCKEDNWKKGLNLYLIKGNGVRELVSQESDDAGCFYIENNSSENFNVGQNVINVRYNKGPVSFETYYMLTIDERKIKSIDLSDTIKNHEYTVGEKVSDVIRFDEEGITVKYENGDEERLSGENIKTNLEIIGDEIVPGKNHIVVSYMDYRTNANFDVDATKNPDILPETDTEIVFASEDDDKKDNTSESSLNEKDNSETADQNDTVDEATIIDSTREGESDNGTVVWIVITVIVVIVTAIVLIILKRGKNGFFKQKANSNEESNISVEVMETSGENDNQGE